MIHPVKRTIAAKHYRTTGKCLLLLYLHNCCNFQSMNCKAHIHRKSTKLLSKLHYPDSMASDRFTL